MTTNEGRVGDWIEERTTDGPPQRGLIIEVLGHPGHRHYRVEWDEEHTVVHFPSPTARIIPQGSAGS